MKKVSMLIIFCFVLMMNSICFADDTRIVVSEVIATTDVSLESIMVNGATLSSPSFTVQDSSKPAYFWPSNTKWQKYYGGSWQYVSNGEECTAGTWRLQGTIYIDNDSLSLALIDGNPTGDGTTHKLNPEGITVTVNKTENA